jgi:hypothetical protein
MSNDAIAIGKLAIWRGLTCLIIDVKWGRQGSTPWVQIRLMGNHTHWTDGATLQPYQEARDVSVQR